MAWVILTTRYGKDVRQPSEADLLKAADELYERVDDTEHPNAWLRYGLDEGPMFIIDGYLNRTIRFAKYADQDDDEPLAEYTHRGEGRESLLRVWTLLAQGDIEKIKAEYPSCGW